MMFYEEVKYERKISHLYRHIHSTVVIMKAAQFDLWCGNSRKKSFVENIANRAKDIYFKI